MRQEFSEILDATGGTNISSWRKGGGAKFFQNTRGTKPYTIFYRGLSVGKFYSFLLFSKMALRNFVHFSHDIRGQWSISFVADRYFKKIH